jgi:two-component system NtrC family sensor kinase
MAVVRSLHLRGLGFRSPIATRLILGFLVVIAITSVAFVMAGARLIRNRIVAEAQEKVRHDLNTARVIYQGNLQHVSDVIRFTADRTLLFETLLSGNVEYAEAELEEVRAREGLDILTVTDAAGDVLLRTTNPGQIGDDQSHDQLVGAVLRSQETVDSTLIVPAEELARESPLLAERAHFIFIDTPMARERPETEETAGMVLEAAAPVFNEEGALIGVIYGGVLLNRRFEIVDEIKQTVFEDMTYHGQDIGTATIFQDDVRISTNVRNADGTRAIGTRIAEDVYDRVVREGLPWIGRAFVVNDWYITAYEPIVDLDGRIIGILYVGLLEKPYVDIQREMLLVFLAITLIGTLVSMGLAIFIARRISVPIARLAGASRELARGNLDARVEVAPGDELGELAEAFNTMASALRERDEKLRDFATKRIMESERLALIGQLSANIAHELNNPLQGIVTYSHLLLERISADDSAAEPIRKIVVQANRCRDIIRGLLDFSRQRKPDKTVCDVNAVLEQCVALVQDQALFHNIEVTKRLAPGLPMAVIDPSQIERVFMNMIINAAEAMEGGGQLRLATRYDSQNRRIEIEFADTGTGIPEENLEKIFDPFFTTKDARHGTGLGLAISYGIIKEHRGTISVESKVGQGTAFLVRLPVRTEEEGIERGERVAALDH